jgi:hypothetical protein
MPTATLTGGLITDVVRAAQADGDGLAAPDSSVGIYEAATNLLANPNAATDTAGWQGVAATLTRDTTVAKFGTTSFKLVATGGDAILLGVNAITGAPLSQARTLYSAWVLPSASAVGKTAFLQINEVGGAQALVFYTASVVLVAGWQRIRLLIPGLTQPDRTSLSAYVYIKSAVNGDTLNVGGVMLDRSTSVVTPYVATTRSTGRIQLPTTRLSPQQGWVAFRFRPDWGDGVPDNPAYLWSWRDDDTHRLDLRWESGRFRMRRSSPAGTEEASIIGVAGANEEVTVVGRWTPTGVSVSKRGQAFRAADTVNIDDTFNRPDQAGWGTAPSGGPWTMTGTGASGAAIAGGKATAPNLTVYGYFRPGQPMSRMWARTIWPAGATNAVVALLSSRSATTPIAEMTHFIAYTPGNWSFQVTETDASALVSLLSAVFKTPIVFDGVTPFDFAIFFDGDVVYLELFDGTRRTVKDSRIAALNQGSFVTYELFNSGGLTPKFDAVQGEIPTGVADTTGAFVPAISATLADVGSKDGTIGYLNGDILWHAAGVGSFADADAAIAAAVSGDPTMGTFGDTPMTRLVWDATGAPLDVYADLTARLLVSRSLTAWPTVKHALDARLAVN